MGPVQVLVLGFDQPSFSGEVLAELARLREAGIVRLVDLLVVSRTADGIIEAEVTPGESGADLGDLVMTLLGEPDGATTQADGADDADGELADVPAWSLAEAVPVGTTAAVALIEHVWAGPLSDAVRRAGGIPLEETWLSREDIATLEKLVSARDG